MSETIRLFVACAPDGLDAESQAVVEHSVISRASQPVEITWMRLTRDKASPFYADGAGRGWNTGNWATPFSWFRWAIPEICGFQGRAIYSDSDVMFLDDIAKLWNGKIPKGKAYLARDSRRLCVTLFDCAAMKQALPPLAELQRHGPGNFKGLRQQLWAPFPNGENWNCLDGDGLPVGDPSVKCVHFTDIATQPQTPLSIARLARDGRKHWFEGKLEKHPRPDLVAQFNRELGAAYAAGYTIERYDQQPRYGKIIKRDLTVYRGGPRLGAGQAA